jgi:hypothetical protein
VEGALGVTKKHEEEVVSRHIEVFASDWDFIAREGTETRTKPSVIIRQIIRKGVRDYQERVTRKLDAARRAGGVTPLAALDRFFDEGEGT